MRLISMALLLLLWAWVASEPVSAGPTTITVTGHVLHASEPLVAIYGADEKLAETNLDAAGNFQLKVAWLREGEGRVKVNERNFYFWLRPGDDLRLTLDAQQPGSRPRFEGSGAALARYLAREDSAFAWLPDRQDALFNQMHQGPNGRMRFVQFLDSTHTLKIQYLAKAFPRPAPAQRAFVSWRRAEHNYGWGISRLILDVDTVKITPQVPGYAFLLDTALQVNNAGALASECFQDFVKFYFSRSQGQMFRIDADVYDAAAAALRPPVRAIMLQKIALDIVRGGGGGADSVYARAYRLPELSAQQREQLADARAAWQAEQLTLPGRLAPDLELKTEAGEVMNLSDLRGKLVYLDFWASWCKPCIATMPAAHQLHEALSGRDVVFLNVSVDANSESWRKAMVKHQVTGLNTISPGDWKSPALRSYGISGIPRFYLIGADGRIINNHAPEPGPEAQKAIEAALKK